MDGDGFVTVAEVKAAADLEEEQNLESLFNKANGDGVLNFAGFKELAVMKKQHNQKKTGC